ncbi:MULTISPECIES: hypothetical protein [Sphingomonas]|uniref:hypothetical protein n=1 Tax=Sphingomonas TaxID=13687 RepID=UPI000AC64306|nr:hypothetical protein [Sphingomonas sp. CCH10-B3]
MSAATLIFVYNAPDGIGAALIDAAHKLISPATYPCSLCAVTYGAVAMRRDWKTYLARLPHRIKFYHRDGFARAFPGLDIALPAILIADADAPPRVLVDAATLDKQTDVASLIATLEAALSAPSGQPG